MLHAVPKLTDLLNDNTKVCDLPVEAIPAMLGELEQLKAALWLRLSVPQNGRGESSSSGDRLLDVEEAAAKLGKSIDSVYRHAKKYPFTVRDGRNLRFSQQGIDRYIRSRTGR